MEGGSVLAAAAASVEEVESEVEVVSLFLLPPLTFSFAAATEVDAVSAAAVVVVDDVSTLFPPLPPP